MRDVQPVRWYRRSWSAICACMLAAAVFDCTGIAQDARSAGPFLGNAFRNGWADQHSIVIWTRTTARPDMNVDGKPFVTINKTDHNKFSKLTDPNTLLAIQLPPGSTLDDMFGACPGAAGEVRLTYYPEDQAGRNGSPGKPIGSAPTHSPNQNQPQRTDWVRTFAEHDFTTQWRLEGLQPGTRYVAIIEARPAGGGNVTATARGRFTTAPDASEAKNLKFCVTTCHDFIRRDDGLRGHKIYPSMSAFQPDFIVHAGDIEYYDKPDPWAWTIELMRFKWGRIFALPSNRSFYQQTTSYFLKDDHDTLKNDCWPGQRYGSVTFEQGVKLFNEEQFPAHQPHYKTVRWGPDIQIWLLEGRDFRSPNNMPDGPEKTILGATQKAWLRDTLASSDATFKLVFSPTPIVGPDRQNKKDNHANEVFAYEGRELRSEFAKHSGLIVFCGDRHWQYASVDDATGLWEFGCGPGSEKHQLGWKPGDKRPVHRFLRVAGGYLSGQLDYTQPQQPKLTLHHRTVDGSSVSEFEFPRDFKVSQSKPRDPQTE